MIDRYLVSFILLLTLPATVGAEIYRCELADGRVIYADKPVNLSDACQPVATDSAKEYLSIQQPSPDRPQAGQTLATEPTAEPETSSGASYEAWAARATTLVENYQDARKRRMRESYLVNKRKAMQEMASLNAEKKAMLADLQESSLNNEEREEIRKILAEIPEDAP